MSSISIDYAMIRFPCQAKSQKSCLRRMSGKIGLGDQRHLGVSLDTYTSSDMQAGAEPMFILGRVKQGAMVVAQVRR
jgi:hypothetical protein